MFLYILLNKISKKHYIGTTNNISRRIEEHNTRNSHYTGIQKGDWDLIFKKEYTNNSQAKKEESRLKKCRNIKYLNWYISTHRAR